MSEIVVLNYCLRRLPRNIFCEYCVNIDRMSRSLLGTLLRATLGAGLGVAIVAVPYSISPFPIDASRGAIALTIILFCSIGMGYGGGRFFEALSKFLDQSGLY